MLPLSGSARKPLWMKDFSLKRAFRNLRTHAAQGGPQSRVLRLNGQAARLSLVFRNSGMTSLAR